MCMAEGGVEGFGSRALLTAFERWICGLSFVVLLLCQFSTSLASAKAYIRLLPQFNDIERAVDATGCARSRPCNVVVCLSTASKT